MLVLIVLILAAVGLALALGGSPNGWVSHRLRWWPLPMLAMAIQLVLYSPPFDSWPLVVAAGPFLGLATMAAVVPMLLRNATGRARPACMLAAIGIGLNLTVMLFNDGRMPRADALAAHPGEVSAWTATEPTLSNVQPAGAETRLGVLADILPEPAWLPSSNVFSIGDLLLASGLTLWAFQITSSQRARPARPLADHLSGV
jgi:hypothetical protein